MTKAFYYVRKYGPCCYKPTELCLISESQLGDWVTAKSRSALLAKIRRFAKKLKHYYGRPWQVTVHKQREGRKIKTIIVEARLDPNKTIIQHIFELQ